MLPPSCLTAPALCTSRFSTLVAPPIRPSNNASPGPLPGTDARLKVRMGRHSFPPPDLYRLSAPELAWRTSHSHQLWTCRVPGLFDVGEGFEVKGGTTYCDKKILNWHIPNTEGAGLAWRRVRGWRASFRVRWYNPIKGIPSLSFRSSVRLPWPRFQAPAHQSGRADFPHPAFGRDHEFAHGRSRVVFPRQIRPWSRHSFTLEKRTYFPDLTLCFRQNHWRSRFVACWSITA